jgi:hypothetical protein
MRFIGNTGASMSGVIGFPVPGLRGGGTGCGKSAWMLYHCFGISFSLKSIRLFTFTPFWSYIIFKATKTVIPAKAGIQKMKRLDSASGAE